MSASPHAFSVDVGDPVGDDIGLTVHGELDLSSASDLTEAIVGAGGGSTTVTLDLRNVSFLDSSAIGAIIAAGQELSGGGRRLRIGPRSAIVSRVLEITGLTEHPDAFDVLPEQA